MVVVLSFYLQTQVVYFIQNGTNDVSEHFYGDEELFHFSNYSKDSWFYDRSIRN